MVWVDPFKVFLEYAEYSYVVLLILEGESHALS